MKNIDTRHIIINKMTQKHIALIPSLQYIITTEKNEQIWPLPQPVDRVA